MNCYRRRSPSREAAAAMRTLCESTPTLWQAATKPKPSNRKFLVRLLADLRPGLAELIGGLRRGKQDRAPAILVAGTR
jgi:hypothetical protein